VAKVEKCGNAINLLCVAAITQDAPAQRAKRTYKWLKKDKMPCDRGLLLKRLPIIGWLRNYSTTDFVADMLAGLTVGLTVIPQGMACAVIAGLPPQVNINNYLIIFLLVSKNYEFFKTLKWLCIIK
jgi:Sulfate permease family